MELLKEEIKKNEESKKTYSKRYADGKMTLDEAVNIIATIEYHNEGIRDAIRIIDMNTAPWED